MLVFRCLNFLLLTHEYINMEYVITFLKAIINVIKTDLELYFRTCFRHTLLA